VRETCSPILNIEENAKQETSMKQVEEFLDVILSLKRQILGSILYVSRKTTISQVKNG
jgi:hypothetical protein